MANWKTAGRASAGSYVSEEHAERLRFNGATWEGPYGHIVIVTPDVRVYGPIPDPDDEPENFSACYRLAAHYLRVLSDQMGTAGCNDLELPDGLVSREDLEEAVAIVNEGLKDDGVNVGSLLDWMLVNTIADHLEQLDKDAK